MLRLAVSRVGPLALRLKAGPIILWPGPTYYRRVDKDTTPAMGSDNLIHFSLPSEMRQSYLFTKKFY